MAKFYKADNTGIIVSSKVQCDIEEISKMLEIDSCDGKFVRLEMIVEILKKLTQVATKENLHLKRRLAEESRRRRSLEEKLGRRDG